MENNKNKTFIAVLLTGVAVAVALAVYINPQTSSANQSRQDQSSLVEESPVVVSTYSATQRHESEILDVVKALRPPARLVITAPLVKYGPIIDGKGSDKAWESASTIRTLEALSQREVELSCVRTADKIFFRVKYPDSSASMTHKSYKWDNRLQLYKQYFDREDVFVFKWSMQGVDAKLALRDSTAHKADIWFWKACRTDPSGYADDKYQVYSNKQDPDALNVTIYGRKDMYLVRSGDSGRSAYSEDVPVTYRGEYIRRYSPRKPTGSRGDVQARGLWKDGYWTIEFARLLDTSNSDDQSFSVGGEYLFGISCYEVAGDSIHPEFTQPLYRHGDVYDSIILKITE